MKTILSHALVKVLIVKFELIETLVMAPKFKQYTLLAWH